MSTNTLRILFLAVFLAGCSLSGNTPPIEEFPEKTDAISTVTNENAAENLPLVATQDAPDGCTWKESSFSQLRFVQFDCGENSPVFEEKNGNIYAESDSETPFIEFFQRREGETKEEAVSRVALDNGNRTSCEVVPSRVEPKRGEVQRYEVAVLDTAREQYELENPESQSPWWDGNPGVDCGTYAQTNGIQYFEFHEEKNVFFFIRVGQDTPGMDVDTIQLRG